MKYWTLFILLISAQLQAQQLAFPSASGFGKYAVGGRMGEVYHVTNLNDSGKGSFRDAVSEPNRTVVFDMGGVINIKDKVKVADHITIAGQTAPGGGITIYGNGVSFSGANNIIVRYVRFRGSIQMSRGTCTVTADNANNIIFDHVSIEWGRWDDLHIKNSSDITLQYCIIGSGIDPQRFGALLEGPVNLTIHHCLWINNKSRNPKGKAKMEYINNVIYNWGSNGFVGGHSAANHYQDIIGNYFIAGPNSTPEHYINEFTATDHVYQKGNYVDLNRDGRLNGRLITYADFKRTTATIVNMAQAVSYDREKIESAQKVFRKVVATAGASLKRDAIDSILIADVKSIGLKGKIYKHEEKENSDLQRIASGVPLKDTDRDGMPDRWEKSHHLNPLSRKDGGIVRGNGYSNLETYLHSLVK